MILYETVRSAFLFLQLSRHFQSYLTASLLKKKKNLVQVKYIRAKHGDYFGICVAGYPG